MSQKIKGPLYYSINLGDGNGSQFIPVKSTGFMNKIAQVDTSEGAEKRIRLGQKNGLIPNKVIENYFTKNDGEKWIVVLKGGRKTRKNRKTIRKNRKNRKTNKYKN
jgi:hypothetical protein